MSRPDIGCLSYTHILSRYLYHDLGQICLFELQCSSKVTDAKNKFRKNIFYFLFFFLIFYCSFSQHWLFGNRDKKDARCQALFFCQKFDTYWQIQFNLACLQLDDSFMAVFLHILTYLIRQTICVGNNKTLVFRLLLFGGVTKTSQSPVVFYRTSTADQSCPYVTMHAAVKRESDR